MSVHKPEARRSTKNYSASNTTLEENSQDSSNEYNNSQTSNSSQESSIKRYPSSSSVNSTQSTENIFQASINESIQIKQRKIAKKTEPESPKTEEKKKDSQKSTKSGNRSIIIVLMGLIGIGIFVGYLSFAQANGEENRKTCKAFDPEGLFNVNDQISVKSAVNEINNFNKPTVLLLLHSNKQAGPLINKRVNMILEYATCKLGKANYFVEFRQEELQSSEIRKDWGKLISMYKQDLLQKNVLLVRHLEKTPAEVATVFHYLCDEHSPTVERLLTIFTLEYQDDEQLGTTSDYNVVEKALMRSWSNTMNADKIDPLITRITNAIIRL